MALALEDAGRLDTTTSPQLSEELDIGLICSTTSSCSRTDLDFFKSVLTDPRLASPGLFVYTLATSFLGEAALRFAISGSSLALIEARPSGAEALRLGLEQLTYGDEAVMLVGISNLFNDQNNEPPFFFRSHLYRAGKRAERTEPLAYCDKLQTPREQISLQ